jgi:response regulator RpfG family c-di-GMP phosphodiesterase
MNDINTLAVDQLNDPRYLKNVTRMGDEFPIVANRDVHSTSGIKLINAGMRINSSLYERLLQHRLASDLEQCLTAENTVNGKNLAAMAATMMREDDRLSLIQSVELEGMKLPDILKQVPLNPVIAFKLTVMRETQPELFRHSIYVSLVSTYIGIQLKLSKIQLVQLATASLLHDIGILHVDPVLLKRGYMMTEAERRHLYVHSVTGWMILKSHPEYAPEVLDAVLQHHERLDGSGYPRGLSGNKIGLFGQIIAVAEIVASRYGKDVQEFGWSRLETILKLNLRRYGRSIVPYLKVFYQDENVIPTCSESDKQAAKNKMEKISTIFTIWEAAWKNCNAGDPVCAFIAERMTSLKMEIVDAGLNLQANDENLRDIHEDSRACFDARILLEETLWQLHSILQETRRRWPANNLNLIPDVMDLWLKETESLLLE